MIRGLGRAIVIAVFAAQSAGCAAWPARGDGGAPVAVGPENPAANTPPASPSPSATSSPSPTATLHPLTIESMRRREYPGSEITIEETLTPGANYARYIASYRSEGLKIYALLTVPYGQPPEAGWPVIVFNHGYIRPDLYRTTERYVAYVDNLARHGYIVFRSDYRGHDESEGIARGAYGAPDYVVDVLNAAQAMRGFSGADPDRIGMWGHSMGGYITLRSMVIDGTIRAGVIWAGVVASYADLLTRWRRTPTPSADATQTPAAGRAWRSGLMAAYGSPDESPEFWSSISAQGYLEDLSGPLQLHHGTGDTSVPVEFSEMLYDQVLEAGGVVELYVYPGADHNLSGPFAVAMQRTIAFFDEYLK